MNNYIVTSVQYNALVNRPFLNNMLAFADKHKVSKILIYIAPGTNVHQDDISPLLFEDDRIELLHLGKEGRKINSNLKLHDTGILFSQINPLTGFQTKLSNKHSFILPSAKIRFLSLPNTSTHPRFLATTGSLTHGNYKMHTAQGRKADLEHQYGFAYVKVINSRVFRYHPVEALKNGNFNYMRESYKNGKVTDEQPACLSIGDWHTGDTCMKTRKRTIAMLEQLKPKYAVWHDFFNGKSINRHERHNNMSRAELWQSQTHVLEKEVEDCLTEMNYFAKRFPNIIFLVAESNHDIFLAHFIGGENFLEDGCNSVFSCKLFVAQMATYQPILQTAMELVGNVAKNVRFLKEDEEVRIGGTLVSAHGHRGVNGARGSGQSFSNYNLRQITGHEHTPKMYAHGMVIGTSTKLKLSYTKGPSSWMAAHGLLYTSGKYSLLTIIH